MATTEKSQFFKLKELTISGYKNIQKLDISFKYQDGITVLIGNNGCGKSNIIEALSSIFAGLYQEKRHIPTFSYHIQYEILYHEIDISYNKGEYVINVDNNPISKAVLEKDKEMYLPKNIIACYSGEYLRLFENFYRPYYDNYISIIKKEEKLPSLPLLYINKYNLEIALLTLFFYDFKIFTDISDFVHNTLKIKKIRNITFTYNKDKKILSWKENEVLRMIKLLSHSEMIKIGEKETIEYDVFKSRLSSYIGNERELFQYLYGATMSKKDKIIKDIDIKLELNTGDIINVDELSEGEKKYILMRTILETLADENSLLLFDEPDAHIHINRKAELKELFEKYPNRENVITTHSPTLAIKFEGHIEGLGVDEKGHTIKIDNDKAKLVSSITEGMWNVHEQNMFLASNKPMTLLVEGSTDKIHIEEAYKHLKEQFPLLNFDIFSMNSSEHIREVLIGLSCSEIVWEKQFVGIFDNDPAGRKDINNGFDKENTDSRIKHVKYKDNSPSTSFYAFLLPKPSDYEDDFTIENCYDASKYENAFSTALEDKKGHFNGLSIDTIAKDIKNKAKTILASKARSFDTDDFEGFIAIFELLDKIRTLKIKTLKD